MADEQTYWKRVCRKGDFDVICSSECQSIFIQLSWLEIETRPRLNYFLMRTKFALFAMTQFLTQHLPPTRCKLGVKPTRHGFAIYYCFYKSIQYVFVVCKILHDRIAHHRHKVSSHGKSISFIMPRRLRQRIHNWSIYQKKTCETRYLTGNLVVHSLVGNVMIYRVLDFELWKIRRLTRRCINGGG